MLRVVVDDSSDGYKLTRQTPTIFSSAKDKVNLFRSRYNLIHRCIIRNPLFQSPEDFKLKNIESIISKEETPDVLVFGMLYQISENEWYLEDLTAKVEIDLSMTKFQEGFFYDGSFVLVEGLCKDKVLVASQIGYPPTEDRLTSRQVLMANGCEDGEILGSAPLDPRGKGLAVFLSDVYLDDERIFQKFEKLFEGYSSCPPVLFVLCGNFIGKSCSSVERLKTLFDEFGALILKFKTIFSQSTFLFIPGPSDLVFGDVLPRPALPDYITEGIRSLSPSTILFRSNPCRIKLFSYTIVVARSEVVYKMSRASISHQNSAFEQNAATTLLSQYHLSPMSPYMSPVYWGCDSCLFIYPHPDLLVMADGECKPYCVDTSGESGGTIIVNPGSFCDSEFCFKVFDCASRTVENSQIV